VAGKPRAKNGTASRRPFSKLNSGVDTGRLVKDEDIEVDEDEDIKPLPPKRLERTAGKLTIDLASDVENDVPYTKRVRSSQMVKEEQKEEDGETENCEEEEDEDECDSE
jgi:hypothetical protein